MPKKTATNKNDQVVFALQEQIKKKKASLKSSERFSPITNCSLNIDGERHNLNVVDIDLCKILLMKIHLLLTAAKDLQLEYVFFSGFSLEDWKTDLQSKLAYLGRKTEEAKLKTMEDKLQQLLSQEARVGIELESIANELGIDDLE